MILFYSRSDLLPEGLRMGLQSVAGGRREEQGEGGEREREGCGLCGFMGVCTACRTVTGRGRG